MPLARRPLSAWLPLRVLGPFVLYECVAMLVLERRRARGAGLYAPLRFANAIIETSLPTVLVWTVSQHWSPEVAFGSWPSMLYFIFIVASTLRLDFALPVFTGMVAAVGYMLVVLLAVPLSTTPDDPVVAPLYHLTKAGIMLGDLPIRGYQGPVRVWRLA
jgi:adenylate cyclase